ncbi:hypothetical protein CBR_g37013 [Chara braunii]|uniref:Uncharacterized protein n=1 Tax=Chara braunii TaxID=69332 RepID=A0A388LM12_CHABU|nr:hypothetical protein CBR_g37013 [Chara braunii]|eukprot:GBG83301.1 hypothetical protein CBR_g37013 [Chara braunii]
MSSKGAGRPTIAAVAVAAGARAGPLSHGAMAQAASDGPSRFANYRVCELATADRQELWGAENICLYEQKWGRIDTGKEREQINFSAPAKGCVCDGAPSHADYVACVSSTPAGGATDHEDDDENTEEDSRFRQWDGGRWADGNDVKDTEGDDDEQRFRDGAHYEEGSLEDDFAEGDGSEGQEDGGHEGDGSEEEENEDASDEDAAEREDNYEGGSEGDEGGADDDDYGNGGSQKRREQSFRATSHDGPAKDDDVLHGTQRFVCMRKRKIRCGKAQEEKRRQAKLISLQASKEAYKRSLEAQSAKPAKEKRERTRSSQRPKKKAKAEETKEVPGSGDEAAGVDPRHTTSKPGELTNDTIDTTKLKKDGRKRWERVKPEDRDDDKVASYHWYTVAGQHTAEAAKRLVAAKSSAAHKWGVHSWKARVVYFDDDHLEGYAYISTFDNTRETRAIPSSFRMAVTAIRGLWQSMKEPKGDWHQAKIGEERTAQHDQYQEFVRKAIRMTPDTSLWSQSLAKRFVRNCSDLLRPYMCLAASGRVVWNLVEKFFDKWEKGELPGQDGVRPVDQEGKAGEAAEPDPAAKTVKDKRVLVHYVQSNKSLPGFYVCINDPPASAWKVFGDFTSREKEMTLEKILAGHVVITSGRAFVKKLMNMQDLYVEVRTERYMVRMFKYVLFKIEQRSEGEWNEKFFIGYDTIMRWFAPRGLTIEKWEETKSKIVAEKTIDVPKRLGGVDEAKLGKRNVGGYKVTTTIYMECPYFLKLFVHEILGVVEQLRDELRRINSNAQHTKWDKRKNHTTYLPICITPMDELHPAKDLTRAVRKLSCHLAVLDLAPLKNLDAWSEQRFHELRQMMTVLCGSHWALIIFNALKVEETVLRNVFRWDEVRVLPGHWRRYSEAASSCAQVGNLPLTGRDSMTIVLHDIDNDLKKVKVGKRCGNTLFDTHYVEELFVRCTKEPISVRGNNKPVYGIWEREPAKMKDLCIWFSKEGEGVLLLGNVEAGTTWDLQRSGCHVVACDGSSNLMEYSTLFIDRHVHNPDNSEEETEDEEIDLPLPDANQNAVRDETPPLSAMGGQQAMEEDVGGTIASTRPDNVMHGTMPKTGGAMEGSTSKCGMKEATPRFVSLVRRVRNDIEGAADGETQNVARADKESVDDQDGMDIEDDTLFHIPDDVPKQLALGDNISYDMKEMKGGPHCLGTKYKDGSQAEVVGDDGKDEKIEEEQRKKASDEGPKFQAHEVVKAVAGIDSHSKQSQGTDDTTVITAQAQGTDEDTREQSAHEKDGGEGPVLMECTGPGMQIVSESTMGERRADVERVSGAEHEKVPSTANREREEENENEEGANKS